eukprot:31499-Pelagococcus_subviridis.AAC.16
MGVEHGGGRGDAASFRRADAADDVLVRAAVVRLPPVRDDFPLASRRVADDARARHAGAAHGVPARAGHGVRSLVPRDRGVAQVQAADESLEVLQPERFLDRASSGVAVRVRLRGDRGEHVAWVGDLQARKTRARGRERARLVARVPAFRGRRPRAIVLERVARVSIEARLARREGVRDGRHLIPNANPRESPRRREEASARVTATVWQLVC